MASILETFCIVFTSDASDAKKSYEEINKSSDQTEKNLNKLQNTSNKLGDAFFNVTKKLVTFAAAAASLYTVINGLKDATNYAIELNNVSRQLGVNIRELDAWGNAVQRVGGTAAGFQQSLRGLAQHLGSSPQLALEVLPQLADVFERIGRVRSLQYGRALGLDESTILLLQQGRREVEATLARQKELGVVNEQDAKIAQDFNLAVINTSHAFRSLYNTLAISALPALTKFFNIITPAVQYLREHSDLVKGALIGIGLIGVAFLVPFVAANVAIIAITAGIAGLITIFAIAYEDLTAFLNGNDSLIGDILKKWPIAGKVVNGVLKLWKASFELLFAPLRYLIEAVEKISSFFNGGNKKLTADIQHGQNLLGLAGSSYFNSQTSNSISNGGVFSPSRSVSTGPITINTQATNADGIASAFVKGLTEHLWQSNSNFDDGVVA